MDAATLRVVLRLLLLRIFWHSRKLFLNRGLVSMLSGRSGSGSSGTAGRIVPNCSPHLEHSLEHLTVDPSVRATEYVQACEDELARLEA